MDTISIYSEDDSGQPLELSPSPLSFSDGTFGLVDIHKLLIQLLESNSPINGRTRLFCRRMQRLMDYNNSLSERFWIGLRDDILYVLGESNGMQQKTKTWERFMEKIHFESQLEQRELQFGQMFGKRKTFRGLLNKHREFLKEYLQKCISLHSKVQVRDLINNIDDLFRTNNGLTEIPFAPEKRKRLEEKLKSINICFDCSDKLLTNSKSSYSISNRSYIEINNTLSNFLPSAEPLLKLYKRNNQNLRKIWNLQKIEDILQNDRWIIVLGDPGSAKTTLLRWIMCIFAKAVNNGNEKITLKRNHRSSVRIPILIRISEFAEWLEQNPTKILMDYIGKHTWFSELYSHNDDGNVLKEFIQHGHALILLDGFDEIADIRQREKITNLISKFIDEYVRAADHFTAFDKVLFYSHSRHFLGEKVIEIQPPNKSGGNQIAITSRIVGYRLSPLIGSQIKHYSLLRLNDNEAQRFINNWLSQVVKSVHEVLLSENIEPYTETIQIFLNRRCNAVKAMFKNSSKSLILNPSLLSLICTSTFESPVGFYPKSRVEVYDYAVQSALNYWKSQQSSHLQNVLIPFLIDLSTYLHLYSRSGLIDAFDIEHLCYLVFQQQHLSYDRIELQKYVKEFIPKLDSDVVIVAAQGLQVFGFQHLSFQEYFVAQSFVKHSSIEEIANCISIFIINLRFREPLLLALGYISWKYSLDDYNKFCNLLVNSTRNYAIPFGSLLFFDAISELQQLPSYHIISTALNKLRDHPCHIISTTYFISGLSKLPENIMVRWIQSYVKDGECLFNFCHCLLTGINNINNEDDFKQSKLIISISYQQLQLFYKISESAEFIIDQTLRRLVNLNNTYDNNLNNELSLYLISHNITALNIHPLILSVLIAVCGGIEWVNRPNFYIIFSPKYMHRESIILSPIIKYFVNNRQPHSIKIQTLIRQYETILQKFLPLDTSVDIVDTFIALICLQGLAQPLIYQKYVGYPALTLAFKRLKRTWLQFKNSCIHFSSLLDESAIKPIIQMFFSHSYRSHEQRILFCLACRAAYKKLEVYHPANWLQWDVFRNSKLDKYLKYQPEFNEFNNSEISNQITENSHRLQLSQQGPYFLYTFVPQSLQQLYYCLINTSTNNADSVSLVLLLLQSLLLLEDVRETFLDFYLAWSMLQPFFKEYALEHYALVLFWKEDLPEEFEDESRETFNNSMTRDQSLIKRSKDFKDESRETFIKTLNNSMTLDQLFLKHPGDFEPFIKVECQRINKAKTTMQNKDKDLRLFAASISLAQLYQAQYRSRKSKPIIKEISLSTVESEEVHIALINIFNPVLRIVACSTILDMRDPYIFDQGQREQLRLDMVDLFQSQLPSLSLLVSTLLFVRCHTVRRYFPVPFQQMANVIGEKLNETSIIKSCQDHEAAYIALRRLNDSDLAHWLSKFELQTKNLQSLLQFNSTIFHLYFTNTMSFGSSNPTVLSIMYLTELVYDAQTLNMCSDGKEKDHISPLKKLNKLWNETSKMKRIMTFEIATKITTYLQILNQEELDQIITDISICLIIEKEALSIIGKWLAYRMNGNLKFFAYYAALQLFIEDSNNSHLIDIINEMFDTDKEFRLRDFMIRILELSFLDPLIIGQILVILHRHIRYSSQISIGIFRTEVLEVILNLELERIRVAPKTSTNSFLLTISKYSDDVESYLAKHLVEFANTQNKYSYIIKEEYLAVIIKAIIHCSIWNDYEKGFPIESYNAIFILLHDHKSPQLQMVIINNLNLLLAKLKTSRNHVFMQDDTIIHLENIISSHDTYSKDVLAICLLTYAHYLLKLKAFRIHRNISYETKDMLNILFNETSSEIISIRAGLCLHFMQDSNITLNVISNLFENNFSITSKQKYNMLLQYKVYEFVGFQEEYERKTINYLQTQLVKFINIFIIEFYNYLHDKRHNRYVFDDVSDYIDIALDLSRKNLNEFYDSIRESSFGVEEFKKEFYLYFLYTNDPRDKIALIEIYSKYGLLTIDFIDMLKCIIDDGLYILIEKYLKTIKEVSDRNVIEKLFEVLDSKASTNQPLHFYYLLKFLLQFALMNVISLTEVHQRVSRVINLLSYQNHNIWLNNIYNIYGPLLGLSCIEKKTSLGSHRMIDTETDINETFDKLNLYLERKSDLFLRRNYFFKYFRSVSNNLN